MDFTFAEEQQMLIDSARRYLAERYSFDFRKSILRSDAGWSRAAWTDFAGLGLLSLNVSEADGGLGAGAIETLALGMAVGEGLVVDPVLSSAVLATRAIGQLASAAQRQHWLPALAGGEIVAAFAHDLTAGLEPEGAVGAVPAGDDWVLNGRLPVVYHAPAADVLVVAASTGTAAALADALFAVPVGSAGVRLTAFRTVDDQCAAELVFDAVRVPKEGCLARDAADGLSAVVDFGLVGLLGEALGALDRTLALTVEYTRTRSQFGGPIARFQALQHRMVDMLMRIEQARSLVYLAATRCDSGGAEERRAALSAAKVLVADAARFVGQQAVQLHGGMGVSDEMPISHYFRRLLAVELRFGSASAHLGRFAAGMSLS